MAKKKAKSKKGKTIVLSPKKHVAHAHKALSNYAKKAREIIMRHSTDDKRKKTLLKEINDMEKSLKIIKKMAGGR